MPVFATLGTDCTVLDYSDRQLACEKAVSDGKGMQLTSSRRT